MTLARMLWDLPWHAGKSEDAPGIARALIAAGADVNIKDNRQETPIYGACYSPSLVPVLAAAGADMNPRDDNGLTPLMTCVFPAFIEAALKAGAHATLQAPNGLTAARDFARAG
jgi:hypothetical protein